MIQRTAQCLEMLDHYKIPSRHKNRLRRNLMEIKKLLLLSPSIAAKVDFFAKERLDAIHRDMHRLCGVHLKLQDIYAIAAVLIPF